MVVTVSTAMVFHEINLQTYSFFYLNSSSWHSNIFPKGL